MKQTAPVGIIVCAAVIFVAAFMPWGSFRASIPSPFQGMRLPTSPFGPSSPTFGSRQVNVAINGWRGNVKFMGITTPNWMVVVAAAAVAGMALLKAYGLWDAPPLAGILLCVYGVLQLGLTVVVLATKGNLGIGILISLVCFIVLLMLTAKETGWRPALASATMGQRQNSEGGQS